ncbi:condensation domain-containing protein [Mycolicibacterium psychrotolerans]|uniref:Condensation domain-containing protein n=1 Tax=Mycolicibacterium psychrotolerans TaxID=216929 RepID=A0A7I7MGR0_9MYCO|nr:condensation domain-containing protein [Mycolicibacterium psychrotolerans]BBX70970.1 hypothetical protein MPSYJ_44310 [Mycolicibacterium psychrotolerans]
MSVSQKQLWHLTQIQPDSRAHNEFVIIAKEGALDVGALRRAFTEVVARHEAWRTTFRDVEGEPYQFVHEPVDVEMPLTDLSHLGLGQALRRAADIATANTLQPYDLARGPLIRPRLVRLSDGRHRLQLSLHQLVFDPTTLHRIVFPELVALYRSFTEGVSSSLPCPLAQYAAYTTWELDWVNRPDAAARIERWRSRLHGVTPLQMPLDHPRPARQRVTGGTIPLTVDRTTVERLRRSACSAGGTLFDGFATAYAWWLHLQTGSEDIVFGSAYDLRQLGDLSAVAGYCVAPLVLRCAVYADDSFCSLVDRIRNTVIDAARDAVPFASLIAGLDIPRDPRNHPLFQAALSFQPRRATTAEGWSLDAMECAVHDALGSSTFDISVELDERYEGHVVGRLVFNADLFDRATAREMASNWYEAISAVARVPDLPLTVHGLGRCR